MTIERCCAVVGHVGSGPRYCGNRAKSRDVNGRPVCGIHKRGNPGISWYGEQRHYPEGTAGTFTWARGEFR